MAERFAVRLTQAAEADLLAIARFIAQDNPRRVASFIDELEEACLALGSYPERFPVLPRYAAQAIRRRVHGNYLIFYRIAGETVDILHVLNGAMDIDHLL